MKRAHLVALRTTSILITMKTLSLITLFGLTAFTVFADKSELSAAKVKPVAATPAVDPTQAIKEGVQITEVGSMRALFVFAKGSEHVETRVTEAFSNVDFRVFPSPVIVKGRIAPQELQKIGNERYADMVVFTKLTSEEKAQLGSLHRFEVEACVQVYNPMSGELMASTTMLSTDEAKKEGKLLTHADPRTAERMATNVALDAAMKETIVKSLEKAHKLFVYEAQLRGVVDHQHLLDIMNYTAKLQGVYHARQISYDKPSGVAVIEIIGAPQVEPYWRAYLNNLPKHEIIIQNGKEPVIKLNTELRKKHGIDFEKTSK
jgi:hypothetical protein